MGVRGAHGWLVGIGLAVCLAAPARIAAGQTPAPTPEMPAIRLAQHHFYSGRYEEAAAVAAELRSTEPENLAAYEIRTSALHFQIKRLIGDAPNKGRAFKECKACEPLFEAFIKDTAAGKAVAKARLKAAPKDETALFFFGKLNLNYIWLQLSTLGRKTGWGEYWDARRSLDAVLKINPANLRARIARAWIDYIVDTRVPFGVQWMLGGGDKKKALRIVSEAAAAETDLFIHAEAEFGLWEMLIREKKPAEAMDAARHLATEFPDNQELRRFIAKGQN